MADYLAQARKQLEGGYQNQRINLQNNVNSQLSEINNSRGTINQNYDGQVQTAKDTGVQTEHSYNNNTLARGLGRSSIATTGIAGIQNTTSKNVTSLNAQRSMQLDNLEKLKAQLRQNLTSSLSGLDKEFNSNLQTIATQLRQRDEDVSYRNSQLAEQKRQFDAQMAWQRQKAAQDAALEREKMRAAAAQAAARARSSSNSRSSSSSSIKQAAWQDFSNNLQKGNFSWLGDNRSALTEAIGSSEVKKMDNELTKLEVQYYKNQGYAIRPDVAEDGYN